METGSKEEDFCSLFEAFLPYIDKEAIRSWDQHFIYIFSFPCTRKAYIQNLVKKVEVVSEKNKF